MTKSSIILENENILLIAKEVVIEGALVVKTNLNGSVELLDFDGNSIAKINCGGLPKVSILKKLELKSLVLKLDDITLTTENVELISIA